MWLRRVRFGQSGFEQVGEVRACSVVDVILEFERPLPTFWRLFDASWLLSDWQTVDRIGER